MKNLIGRKKTGVVFPVVLALAWTTAIEASAQEASALQEELASVREESVGEGSFRKEKAEETSGRAIDRLLVALSSIEDEIALLEASSGLEPSKVLIWDTERAIRGNQENAELLGEALVTHQEQVLTLQDLLGGHEAVTAGLEGHGIRAREVIAAHVLKGGYLLLFVSADGLSHNTSSVEVHDAAEDPQ